MDTSSAELRRQAHVSYPEYDYVALTPAVLAGLTREHGVEFATVLWYERVRSTESHRVFIVAVEARVQTRRMGR